MFLKALSSLKQGPIIRNRKNNNFYNLVILAKDNFIRNIKQYLCLGNEEIVSL